MKYVLEYMNEFDDIEMIRFDTETQTYETVKRVGGDYDPPDSKNVFYYREVQTDDSGGWLEMLGRFEPRPHHNHDSYNRDHIPAYAFIEEMKRNKKVPSFIASLVDSIEKNADKDDFIDYFNTGKPN